VVVVLLAVEAMSCPQVQEVIVVTGKGQSQ
jgi:hypothetical protein